jgi:hypothetical protein
MFILLGVVRLLNPVKRGIGELVFYTEISRGPLRKAAHGFYLWSHHRPPWAAQRLTAVLIIAISDQPSAVSKRKKDAESGK